MKRLLTLCAVLLLAGTIPGCVYPVAQSPSVSGVFTPLEPAHPQEIYGSFPGVPDRLHMMTLEVTGKGVPPDYASSRGQAAILAERAAIADAYRRLAEKIRGVYLRSCHQVDNMAVDYDQIRVETETWLRGAELVRIKRGPDDVTEATLRVKIQVSPAQPSYVYESTAPPEAR